MTSLKQSLPQTLVTERLVLTAPSAAHVPAIAKLANNEKIYRVMARLPFPYGEDDARFFVETITPSDAELCYAIELEGQFIGVVGLSFEADALPALGYWLGEPYWGFGYASEAAAAVVEAARASGVTALRSQALKTNQASRNVLKKSGFTEIGEGVVSGTNLAHRPMVFMHLDLSR